MITKNNTQFYTNINTFHIFNLELIGSHEPIRIFNRTMKGGTLE